MSVFVGFFVAKYQTPTMNSIQGQNIKDNTDVTLFCNATGGDQKGYIQWFDEFGTNWTQNSELVSSKNENGLFNLSSRLVLKAPSSNYTCLVFNARGVQEGKASLNLQLMSMSKLSIYFWVLLLVLLSALLFLQTVLMLSLYPATVNNVYQHFSFTASVIGIITCNHCVVFFQVMQITVQSRPNKS